MIGPTTGTRVVEYKQHNISMSFLRYLALKSVRRQDLSIPNSSLFNTLSSKSWSLTYERACPAVSADELATRPEAVTGPSSSFILGSSEADTQREGFDQACLPAACTHLVSTADPTDSTPKASVHTYKSQQNSLGIPDQLALATLAHRYSSHDSTIELPLIHPRKRNIRRFPKR